MQRNNYPGPCGSRDLGTNGLIASGLWTLTLFTTTDAHRLFWGVEISPWSLHGWYLSDLRHGFVSHASAIYAMPARPSTRPSQPPRKGPLLGNTRPEPKTLKSNGRRDMPRSGMASARACSTFSKREVSSTRSLGMSLLRCFLSWHSLILEQGFATEFEILDGPEAHRGLCWHRSYRSFIARRPPGSLDGPVLDVCPRLSIGHPGKPSSGACIPIPHVDRRRLEAPLPALEIQPAEPKIENLCRLT